MPSLTVHFSLLPQGSGDLFGEDVSRKTPIRRSNGDVRALTYCDLLYLSRANLLGVLHLYPDFAETFSQKLEMTFNLGLREVSWHRRFVYFTPASFSIASLCCDIHNDYLSCKLLRYSLSCKNVKYFSGILLIS